MGQMHWAEISAQKVISSNPNKECYVVASGVTPSGVVHIGHFREVMTSYLIVQALERAGKKVKFIYSWDDFDVFRKVPVDMPQQEMLQEHLRRSIVDVPDPYGKYPNYAERHMQHFEYALGDKMNMQPEFIRQSERYRSGVYADGILKALENKDTIRKILDQYRKKPLPKNWLPLAGFCGFCKTDDLKFIWSDGPVDNPYLVGYLCNAPSCYGRGWKDLRKGCDIKLPWRVDWPMRWAYEGVDFEPGGKDHSTDGGSYDTGKQIAEQVYGIKAPQYVAYNFISAKGGQGKLSSSEGNLITLNDVLEIYEPNIIKWMFANYRPNAEFQISFDTDVIKIYGEYDKVYNLAFREDVEGKAIQKQAAARTILNLSVGKLFDDQKYKAMLIPFRELSMTAQIFNHDLGKMMEYHQIPDDWRMEQFMNRAGMVQNWLYTHAPDSFKYSIRKEPIVRDCTLEEKEMLSDLVNKLENLEEDKKVDLRTICEGKSIELKDFSKIIYEIIIGRENGPPIPTLIQTIGPEILVSLIKPSIK